MKFRYYITMLILMLQLGSVAQQQTLFTNFLLNPYQYNPAYAGVVLGTQFNLSNRSQWVGFEDAPRELALSGWGNFKKRPYMAAGGMIVSNRSGLLQRTAFQGSYTYHLKINKTLNMSFGLAFGGVQYNVKMYDARAYDQDDNFLSSDVLRAFAFDANAGFHLYSKKFFLGLSSQQMLNSKIRWANTTGRLTPHYYLYSGYNFKLDKKGEWILQPSILARFNGPSPSQLEYGLKLLYKEIMWTGGSFRHRVESVKSGGNYSEVTSASLLFGCTLKKSLNLGYAYDFTTSKLSNYSSGSHELFISYLLPYKRKKSAAELAQEADEKELNTIDNSIKTNLKNKKKAEEKKKEENQESPENKSKEPEVKPEPPAEKPNLEDSEGEKQEPKKPNLNLNESKHD